MVCESLLQVLSYRSGRPIAESSHKATPKEGVNTGHQLGSSLPQLASGLPQHLVLQAPPCTTASVPSSLAPGLAIHLFELPPASSFVKGSSNFCLRGVHPSSKVRPIAFN